jgi:hypothetical protein
MMTTWPMGGAEGSDPDVRFGRKARRASRRPSRLVGLPWWHARTAPGSWRRVMVNDSNSASPSTSASGRQGSTTSPGVSASTRRACLSMCKAGVRPRGTSRWTCACSWNAHRTTFSGLRTRRRMTRLTAERDSEARIARACAGQRCPRSAATSASTKRVRPGSTDRRFGVSVLHDVTVILCRSAAEQVQCRGDRRGGFAGEGWTGSKVGPVMSRELTATTRDSGDQSRDREMLDFVASVIGVPCVFPRTACPDRSFGRRGDEAGRS